MLKEALEYVLSLAPFNSIETRDGRHYVDKKLVPVREDLPKPISIATLSAEEFIVGLLTDFVVTPDLTELLRVASNLSAEQVTIADDDGISQKVTMKKERRVEGHVSGEATRGTGAVPLVSGNRAARQLLYLPAARRRSCARATLRAFRGGRSPLGA